MSYNPLLSLIKSDNTWTAPEVSVYGTNEDEHGGGAQKFLEGGNASWLGSIILISAVGVALISSEEEEAQKRWENQKEQLSNSMKRHQEEIEFHIKEGKGKVEFFESLKKYKESIHIADLAYQALTDARTSINNVNKQLNDLKKGKLDLEEELKIARSQKDKAQISKIIEGLKLINKTRSQFFEKKNSLIKDKDNFYNEVRELNAQTSKLKRYIRDNYGHLGRDWFDNLEAKKLARNN